MSEYISGNGEFRHPRLGVVRFVVRRQARKFVARWKGGILHLTLPPYTGLSDLERALDSMMPWLLVRRPADSLYEFGRDMRFELFSVKIVGVDNYNDRCTLHRTDKVNYEIRIDKTVDLGAPEVIEAVARMMKSIARYIAQAVLLQRAAVIAGRLGVRPAEWRLTSGRKTLGRCDSRRVISLSVVLAFLPEELRDYVVCHELAHLTEMNHSPKFHALCDRYCNGREAELERKLKQFHIPLP